MFDESDEDDGDAACPHERAPNEEAKAILDDWLELKVQIITWAQTVGFIYVSWIARKVGDRLHGCGVSSRKDGTDFGLWYHVVRHLNCKSSGVLMPF